MIKNVISFLLGVLLTFSILYFKNFTIECLIEDQIKKYKVAYINLNNIKYKIEKEKKEKIKDCGVYYEGFR